MTAFLPYGFNKLNQSYSKMMLIFSYILIWSKSRHQQNSLRKYIAALVVFQLAPVKVILFARRAVIQPTEKYHSSQQKSFLPKLFPYHHQTSFTISAVALANW